MYALYIYICIYVYLYLYVYNLIHDAYGRISFNASSDPEEVCRPQQTYCLIKSLRVSPLSAQLRTSGNVDG